MFAKIDLRLCRIPFELDRHVRRVPRETGNSNQLPHVVLYGRDRPPPSLTLALRIDLVLSGANACAQRLTDKLLPLLMQKPHLPRPALLTGIQFDAKLLAQAVCQTVPSRGQQFGVVVARISISWWCSDDKVNYIFIALYEKSPPAECEFNALALWQFVRQGDLIFPGNPRVLSDLGEFRGLPKTLLITPKPIAILRAKNFLIHDARLCGEIVTLPGSRVDQDNAGVTRGQLQGILSIGSRYRRNSQMKNRHASNVP